MLPSPRFWIARDMCLILLAYQPNEHHRLIVAANRDEFYGRPSASATFWSDAPTVLAGRDLEAGGTWLGVDDKGRFAAVTNFRRAPSDAHKTRSRGDLAQRFLCGDQSAEAFYQGVGPYREDYRGFNVLLMDNTGLFYGNNLSETLQRLSPGIYGLSNQRLNCDWPKVTEGQERLGSVIADPDIEIDGLLEILRAAGDARPFSNSFIAAEDYGTCVSSALVIEQSGQVLFTEQGFQPGGALGDRANFNYQVRP
ncbi:MAG: hypothetical protein ACJASJ_000976 [Candidatus Azotimanducaceae bacterium]|jgi:uncharacterized protein with NRDE domain